MTFLTFFLYYIGSTLVYKVLQIGVIIGRNYLMVKKVKKAHAQGKLKMITIEELMDQLHPNEDEDKKRWN